MTNPTDKLRQNLTANAWFLLAGLIDKDHQQNQWATRGDIHAMEDLLEDFDDSVAGFTDRNFGESLAYVYDDCGVLVGNALLPV